MNCLAAVAVFAALSAGASAAFAETRGTTDAVFGDDREAQAQSVVLTSSADDQTDGEDAGAPAPLACSSRAADASTSKRCQGGRAVGYNLQRRIDWSSVGPSPDDFAAPEEPISLRWGRVVATYRF